jgi:hypothetical protein
MLDGRSIDINDSYNKKHELSIFWSDDENLIVVNDEY